MTSTPQEPDQDPTVAPSGDPSPEKIDPDTPGETPNDPAGDPEKPHGDPLTDDSEPGQMPDHATDVGA
jgi:hypothetical protein